jgi:hypothetical protein
MPHRTMHANPLRSQRRRAAELGNSAGKGDCTTERCILLSLSHGADTRRLPMNHTMRYDCAPDAG